MVLSTVKHILEKTKGAEWLMVLIANFPVLFNTRCSVGRLKCCTYLVSGKKNHVCKFFSFLKQDELF